MDSRNVNKRNRFFNIVGRKLFTFKYYRLKFYHWFKVRILKKEYMTIREFKRDRKSKTKNQIIKEIVATAARINKGTADIEPSYKKELRKYSKSILIKTLIELKLKYQVG